MCRSIATATAIVLLTALPCWSDEEAAQGFNASLSQAQHVQMTDSVDGSAIELIETPLLRFGEPTRGDEGGSLWAWGRSGRPLVISEIYHRSGDEDSWFQTLTLTSTELVTATTAVGRWTPQRAPLKMTQLEEVPPVSGRPTRRLQQMRQIVRRYSAHEFWDPNNSRYELRLLQSPLHRYDDAEAGIVDGAVFAFAHGTNPEILVLIEAHRTGEVVQWQAGFASMGSAEMHVTLDDADVWNLPRATGVTGRPSDPYWLFVTTKSASEQ